MRALDRLRATAHSALERVPGRVGETLRKANEALGRPLADSEELDDRREFAQRLELVQRGAGTGTGTDTKARDAAPVIVYFMDKQKRDVGKLTDILDANGITYAVTNIQDDPAAQYAVRRDSHGKRLPVVFIAGDCVGGREELINAASSGELKRKVFG
jgi:glutaredoxin-related protein